MEMNRVRQILSSPSDVTVLYNGVSVWIDSCDDVGQTASVHLRDGEEETRKVPVTELQEEE